MNVKIGPYTKWVGPYQIAEALCWWVKEVENEHGIADKPDWVHNFGTWLAEDRHGNDSWLTTLCNWIESKKSRNIKIHIDPYDIWSMYDTLGIIILPMLKALKDDKHGSPTVDDDDVPDELKSTAAPAVDAENGEVDDNFHKRWEYVIDEMIFAFEHTVNEDWQDEFRTGEIDILWTPVDKEGNEVSADDPNALHRMDKGPNDTYECDYDGIKKVDERIQKGLILFGKYYRSLWT